MSDAAATIPTTEAALAPAASPKKAVKKTGAAKTKKPATKPTHPPASEMVNAAIAALKDNRGSSLQAIKKYIAATYKVDVEKQAIFIKKYLKAAVTKKTLVQTKGSGAAGSFKLAPKGEVEKKVVKKFATKKSAGEKKAAAKKSAAKKPVAKEATGEKKAVAKKPAVKKPAAKPKAEKPKTAKAVKSPSKAKKTGKAPSSAKPKAPKPKKAALKAKPAKK